MKLGENMWRYLKSVFERDGIDQYTYDASTGEVKADISARRFKEALEDAFCEKQSQEYYDGHIPVYSLKTVKNRKKMNKLQKFYGLRSYVILDKDVEKYRREFGI